MADRDLVALEAELRELAHVLVLPPVPDVRAAVRARVAGAPPPRLSLRRDTGRGSHRSRLLVAFAALLALLAALAVTPAGQAAAAHLLRLVGIEFAPGASPSPHGSGLLPGQRGVTLEAARRQAAFAVDVPRALGRPDAVAVSDEGRVVSLIYGAGPGRPAANLDGVAVRLDEFDGTLGPVFEKFLGGAGVQRVSVNGGSGAWVNGPHEVLYLGRDGQIRQQSARLSARTLIWQRGNVTLRLEGEYSLQQALRVAQSVG